MERRDIEATAVEDYLCGRLDKKAKAAFEAALEADPGLRAQLAFARQIKAAARSDAPAAPELGWARLNRAIDKENESLRAGALPGKRFTVWQTAGIAASFAIICSFATAYFSGGREPDIYLPATAAPADAQAKVVFQPDARVDDINALLTRVNARVIAGPSAIGVYDVQFAGSIEIAPAIADLKAQAHLVEMVTPVDD